MIEPPLVDDLPIQRANARNCVEDFENIRTVAGGAQPDAISVTRPTVQISRRGSGRTTLEFATLRPCWLGITPL
jgi:hypothetical protein